MATLHVRLANNTGAGMKSLRDDMQVTTEAADELSAAMADGAQQVGGELDRLHEQHQQQIKIIHEHQSSWTSLAATVIPAIGSITVASIKYAATLATLAAQQKYLETLMSPLAGSQRAWNFALNLGEKAALRGAASLAGYGAAAATVGTMVATTTALVKGFETLLENTGRTKKGTIQVFDSTATGEQVLALERLKMDAEEAGITLDTAMQAAGKTWKDFGAEIIPVVETNLDRVRSATSQFGATMSEFTAETSKALADNVKWLASYSAEWQFVEANVKAVQAVWTEFDRELTQGTENYANNLRQLSDLITGVETSMREASAAVDKAQSASVDDFARVRIAEAQVAKAAEERAEAARIAGLTTEQAIDGEIAKMKERRGIMAANDQFDEAAQKKYVQGMESLERRRVQLFDQRQQDEANARRQRVDAEKKANDEILKAYSDAFEARNKLTQDFNSRQLSLNRQQAQSQADIEQESRDAARDSQLSALNRNAPDSNNPAAQQQHAAAVFQLKRGFISQEFEERKAAIEKLAATDRANATSELERQKIDFKAQEDLLAAKADAMKQVHALDRQLHEQRLDWVAKEKQAAEDKHKQAIADAAAMMQKDRGNGQGSALDQLRSQFSQRDVARQVGNQRAEAAGRDFRESGRAKAAEDQLVGRGMDRADAERRVMAQQRKMERQAFSQGFGDTIRGKNQDEAAVAQNQLVQATAQQAAASGELAPVVAQGLAQAAQQAIQATQASQQALAMAKQIQNALIANGQRQRATNGSLR